VKNLSGVGKIFHRVPPSRRHRVRRFGAITARTGGDIRSAFFRAWL